MYIDSELVNCCDYHWWWNSEEVTEKAQHRHSLSSALAKGVTDSIVVINREGPKAGTLSLRSESQEPNLSLQFSFHVGSKSRRGPFPFQFLCSRTVARTSLRWQKSHKTSRSPSWVEILPFGAEIS